MELISIVIPVYNSVKTLRKCVESLVYGQERNIEIVLVDDCSEDTSWEECICLEKEFSQVKCYKNFQNKGVSYTRNEGLKKINGKYVLFVDSDDWVSGKYVKKMVETMEGNSLSLVICGYWYLNKLEATKIKYCWNKEQIINQEEFFELREKLLLQQLWNKIFRRDIIENNHIRFDETQSMGEDFQFVLDYMEAAKIEKCLMINEPLYYYIRYNNNSLMSQFAFTKQEKAYERNKRLYRLAGVDNSKVQKQYGEVVQNTKYNLVYQISRSKLSKKEKLVAISDILSEESANKYYHQQRLLLYKEKINNYKNKIRRIPKRLEGRIQRNKCEKIVQKAKRQLQSKQFTIISQNCIGGVFYHDMGMEFLSPTINLYFREPDFVRFVLNLKYYLNLEMEMCWEEEYPIGVLDDITVRFMHYTTCREAKDSWEKRKERINWNKIIVFATDMEGFSDEVWDDWKEIEYPKLLFTVRAEKSTDIISYPEYESIGHVPDLIPKREFYKDGILINKINGL